MIDGKNYLFVVAHHDDEVLFCGGLLSNIMNKRKDIVVMSNPMEGRPDTNDRKDSFINVCKFTNSNPYFGDFQDIGPSGLISDSNVLEMSQYLLNICSNNEYDYIITHNENGEYGHSHHKLVHQAVRMAFGDNIYCFGYGSGVDCNKIVEYDKNIKKKMFSFYPHFDPLIGYLDIAYQKEIYYMLKVDKNEVF